MLPHAHLAGGYASQVALEDALVALAREVAAALTKFADSLDGVHLEEQPAGVHQIPGVPTTEVHNP